MAKLSQLAGTPYHIGRYTRKAGDEKRHQARCSYFENVTKTCVLFSEKCHGAAHCSRYKEGEKVTEVLKLADEQTAKQTTTRERHYKKKQDTLIKVNAKLEKDFEVKRELPKTSKINHSDDIYSLYQKSLVPGRLVVHKTFGQGEITRRTDGLVSIKFQIGEKNLDIRFCMETKALKFLSS